jgi:hypothetical protein
MSDAARECSKRVFLEGSDSVQAKRAHGNDAIQVGDHVIGFLDFLGQRSKLESWDFHPTTQPETERFIAGMKESFGVIFQWRESMRHWFSAWDVLGKLPSELSQNPPLGYKEFEKSQRFDLGFMQFSDTLISFTPVVNEAGSAPLGGLCSMIYTHAMAMLFGLATGTPLRGALHIGMVGIFSEGDIYGPAFVKAYDLENEVADYPRVVVSNELVEYLTARREDTDEAPQSRAACFAAERCLSMVTKDNDGEWIVHYLSDDAMLGIGTSSKPSVLRVRAREFARVEHAKFNDRGATKLAAKYARLLAYHDAYPERTSN